jgi:hypothetical protein
MSSSTYLPFFYPICVNQLIHYTNKGSIKMKNKIYHTVGTILKQNIPHCQNNSKTKYTTLSEQFQNHIHCIKIVERGKIDTEAKNA